jgi:hypothetical protein
MAAGADGVCLGTRFVCAQEANAAPLYQQLLVEADADATVLAAGTANELAGYACVHADGGRIGPFLADAPTIAETLLASAFDLAPDVERLRLNLPPGNEIGAGWLRGLGVETAGWDGRMARGADVPKREETLYGMAVGALG